MNENESQEVRNAVAQLFQEAQTPEQIAERFKNKFKGGAAVQRDELAFAMTVLLVDLASADQNFDRSEYGVIFKGVQRIFGMPGQEVTEMIGRAQNTLQNMRGVSRFGDLLREQLDEAEKKKVMQLIDHVIMADGVEDGFETYLRQKFADLLGMPLEESIE